MNKEKYLQTYDALCDFVIRVAKGPATHEELEAMSRIAESLIKASY